MKTPITLPIEGVLCLVDWDCFEYKNMQPQVLIWGKDKGVLQWLCADSKACAGFGLKTPAPTHLKYIGKRPERITDEE